MPRMADRIFIVLLIGLATAGRAQSAQSSNSSTVMPCEGEIVSSIEFVPGRPPFSGAAAKWRSAARAVGLHHATTRPEIIKAFLALHEGRPCTERRRTESERILRAQQFIGDA